MEVGDENTWFTECLQLSKMLSSLSSKKEPNMIEELGIPIDPKEVDGLLPNKSSGSVSGVDLSVISDIE